MRVGTVHSVRENTVYTKAPPGFGATFELKLRCGYIQHVSFSEMTVGIVQHNKWVSTRLVKQIAARTVALQEAVQVPEKQPGNCESGAGAIVSEDDSASTDESDSAGEEDTNEDEQSQIDDEMESNPASNDGDDTTTNVSRKSSIDDIQMSGAEATSWGCSYGNK